MFPHRLPTFSGGPDSKPKHPTKTHPMKLSLICTASIIFGAALGIAEAQDRPAGRGPGHRPAPADAAKHLSERYAKLAAYDADKNGALDEIEQAAVAQAIAEGTLKLPHPRGGRGPREGGRHPRK